MLRTLSRAPRRKATGRTSSVGTLTVSSACLKTTTLPSTGSNRVRNARAEALRHATVTTYPLPLGLAPAARQSGQQRFYLLQRNRASALQRPVQSVDAWRDRTPL